MWPYFCQELLDNFKMSTISYISKVSQIKYLVQNTRRQFLHSILNVNHTWLIFRVTTFSDD